MRNQSHEGARAWIYCRVSTVEQAIDGGSLPTQFRQCRRMVDRMGWKLGTKSNYDNPGVFSDPGVSAWKVPIMDRPGFRKLWEVAKPGDRFVSLSLDRQFRSVKDFCTTWPIFEGRNIVPVFCRENIDMSTPTGKLVGTMTAVFAEYKSNLISHRVKESYRIRRDLAKQSKTYVGPESLSRVKALRAAPSEALAMFAGDLDELDGTETGRVFGYTRVSTPEQSLDSQHEAVQRTMRYLVQDGYEPGTTYSDHGVSAFKCDWGDRKAGRKLLAELRAGDVVVVTRADRIFRSIADMAVTMQRLYGRGIHIVTGCGIDTRTMSGRQMIQAVSMMASWESEMNSWRAKLAHKHFRKSCGQWHFQKQLPRYMKTIWLPDGRWTAIPDLEWLEECRIVSGYRDRGNVWDKVSSMMEDRLHEEQRRLRFPTGAFKKNALMSVLLRKKPPSDKVDATLDWFDSRSPLTVGKFKNHYRRDWLTTYCKTNVALLPRIEALVEQMGLI